MPVAETGEEVLSSPEWVTPAASALGSEGRVVDGARGVTSQLVTWSPMAVGAHSGGGVSPEKLRRHRVVDSALEALT